MAIIPTQSRARRGFALLIAVIFMTVMLSFGLLLTSLSYKQIVLSSSSINSQYAFYAADSALECTLYADQQQNLFAYPSSAPAAAPGITCDNKAPVNSSVLYVPTPSTSAHMVVNYRLAVGGGNRCADISLYKYKDPQTIVQNGASSQVTTYVFSQGYNVPCSQVTANGRFVARGLYAHY